MSIRLLKVHALVTIQDSGRWGFQSSGVSTSGPMDEDSMMKVNMLVGNNRNDSCLEIGSGTVELATEDNLISFSGLGHKGFIDDAEISFNKSILVKRKSKIKLKPSMSGAWSYMAVAGGFNVPNVLGSQSTYLSSGFGGLEGRVLVDDDIFEASEYHSDISESIIKSLKRNDKSNVTSARWSVGTTGGLPQSSFVRIVEGPEWSWLSEHEQLKLLKQLFSISRDSNRMGYRLEGNPIARKADGELISSGVTKGTIQLTNDGKLIVLMADSQTVGGYPRIAQVVAVDIGAFAQKRPGTEVRFNLISHEEAEQLFLNRERDLKKIREGIRLKFL